MKEGIGKFGEKIACNYLRNKGYTIIETNFSNSIGKQVGEIDIIAKDKEEFVFVEVKTRIFNAFKNVFPEENITRSKLQKCQKIAEVYIKQKRLWDHPYRFDSLAIIINQEKNSAKIRHNNNIFF